MVNARQIAAEADLIITGMMDDVRLGKQVEIERIDPVVEKMTASIVRNKDALLGLGRIRSMDKYTFEHSASVGVLLFSFAQTMGLKQEIIHQIGVGALLHEIGKSLTPLHILNKPGRFTDEESAIMREHVVDSRRIQQEQSGITPIALAIAAEHHERYDGTGYPDKKRGA